MAGTRKVVWAALIGNGLIAVVKFAAHGVVGSPALLAEAFHSVADTVNQVFLLISLRFQGRAPTDEHPFGFGKERFFWAFLAAVFIFVGGAWAALRHGFEAWFHPDDAEWVDPTIGFVVLGAATVFETVALTVAVREVRARARRAGLGFWASLKRSRDTTLKTALGEDTAALLGLLLAALALALRHWTGDHRWDAAGSIAIGCVLAAVAVGLALESRSLLIGEAADSATRRRIAEIIRSDEAIDEVGDLLTMYLSPDTLLVTAHVGARSGLTAEELAVAVEGIEDRLRRAVPSVRRLFIEAQPAGHPSLARRARRLSSASHERPSS